jgi:ParB family chromosome partitioning protein
VRTIVARNWSVRQAEEAARTEKAPKSATRRRQPAADADLAALERQLGDMLGLRVEVTHKGDGGTVRLSYSSLDQLDMICQRLSGETI